MTISPINDGYADTWNMLNGQAGLTGYRCLWGGWARKAVSEGIPASILM